MPALDPSLLGPERGQIFIPRRQRQALLAVTGWLSITLASAAFSLFVRVNTFGHMAYWASTAVFGGITVWLFWRELAGGTKGLWLTRDGFVSAGIKKEVRSWDDVRDFRAVRLSRGGRKVRVGYGLTDSGRSKQRPKDVIPADAYHLLPDYLAVNPSELGPLMERWRSKFADGQG